MKNKPGLKKQLNIVFLGSQMEIAGAQQLLLAQANWFKDQGHRVLAVFLYDKANLHSVWSNQYTFSIISLNARRPGASRIINLLRLVRAAGSFLLLLSKNRFDVIETFTIHSNIFGIPLAYLARIPVRIPTHHGFVGGSQGWLQKIHGRLVNSRMTSKLVAVSEKAGEVAENDEGVKREKIEIILNGIAIPPKSNGSLQMETRKALRIKEDQILILSVGRLVEQKGFGYYLRAARIILAIHPNAIFAIAGDGELRERLEEEARKLGISKSINFLGIREDIPQLLLAADIYLTTSLWEGLSLALLEAMAAGLPVVSTAVEGVSNVLVNDVNGIVVPIKDVEAIAAAVSRLISNSQLRHTLGENALSTIVDGHSLEKMCRSYQTLFRNVGNQ